MEPPPKLPHVVAVVYNDIAFENEALSGELLKKRFWRDSKWINQIVMQI